MTDYARIGFPRGVGRLAPVPEPLAPRVGFPRRREVAAAPETTGPRATPSERFPHVPPGADTIPFH